jgi:transposase InsO family protein
VERFHRSTREALGEDGLRNLSQARELISEWVREYNETRLHAGLGYLTPAEYYRGDPTARRAEREAKLSAGRERRRTINQARFNEAA